MPCIQTTTSVSVSDAQKTALKERFGKAIEIFPGKTERWLMCTLCDETPVCMAGDGETRAVANARICAASDARVGRFARFVRAGRFQRSCGACDERREGGFLRRYDRESMVCGGRAR